LEPAIRLAISILARKSSTCREKTRAHLLVRPLGFLVFRLSVENISLARLSSKGDWSRQTLRSWNFNLFAAVGAGGIVSDGLTEFATAFGMYPLGGYSLGVEREHAIAAVAKNATCHGPLP
jgi:hypothetical protein